MIHFNNETRWELDFDWYCKLYRKLFDATMSVTKIKDDRDVYVNIVDQEEITNINNKYRKKNNPTDVISFAFDESVPSKEVLGEIYICYEIAQKQAIEYNHSLMREMSFLFVHGLLHLLGYDHLNDEDEKKMINIQKKVLEKCKIYKENYG